MLKRIFPLLLLLTFGCIDPLNMGKMKQQKHLAVEGSFTNMPELNYVRLSYAQPYDYPYNEFITDAEVYVTSSEGERYNFVYGGDGGDFYANTAGSYFPEFPLDAAAQIGHTYTLHVVANGRTYQSTPATVKAPIPIDSVHFEVDEQVFSFKGYQERKKWPGYRVLVNYQDPEHEKNFLRWTFASQYEVSTQPEEYISPSSGLPAPKSCCSRCFLSEKLDRFRVVNDRLVNGKKVINQEVLFLPFERYLGVKHKLKVYQHSLTEEAYNFFRIMEQQKEAKGTVFDPPPAEVKGNMFNPNDAAEQVIGFFDASAVATREVVILRKDIDYPVAPFRWPDDCREIPGASKEIPADWLK
ncbi:DUF4249 domain-containing protein [Pontibacter lucknowensis]|uniref:DUF4249 domain-containing protein n=1 Tax=Pontibacter lucknowensis TaxID=1077936 RepID=A0A1N7B9G3_9BACT|nr:DUF4249 domain-containing protein [Pontibacter lucknowensis]SIR47999.1 protein of unknown function [Pontibacter lucknowensis]